MGAPCPLPSKRWNIFLIGSPLGVRAISFGSLFVALAGYFLFGRRFDNRFVIGLVIALEGAIAFELNKVQLQLVKVYLYICKDEYKENFFG